MSPTAHWNLGEHAFTSQWAVGDAEGMEQVTCHVGQGAKFYQEEPCKLAFVNGYFRYLREAVKLERAGPTYDW